MSGHSKWSKIKRQKAVNDSKRGNVFTKISKQITVAAASGSDPATNFKLRLAIEAAKKVNLPKDKIQTAIDRADKKNSGEALDELLFEIRGSGGIMVIATFITDSRNRTTAEVKSIVNKSGAALTDVSWQFKQIAKILARLKQADEELELELIDQGATDFEFKGNHLEITGSANTLEKIAGLLREKNIPVLSAEIIWQPNSTISSLSNGDQQLVGALEEQADLDKIFTNLANE